MVTHVLVLVISFFHFCRETVASTDDGWVVSDGPDSLDIATHIQKSLMELAHD